MPYATLSMDFETASTADLRRTGAATYAENADTRVLCMAYAFDDQPVQVWREGQPFPPSVLAHVQARREVRAWNAAFEYVIWNNTLLRQLGLDPDLFDMSINQLSCTMARAAHYGLPLSLDMAGPAAGVLARKDKAGHALMMRMCRPRSRDPVTNAPVWWHETDPAKFDDLCDYCIKDVEVERAVGDTLPAMPAKEARVWALDQRMNERGVGVDYPFVERLKDLALDAVAAANQRLAQITSGEVKTVTSTAKMLAYVQSLGYPHDNLRKPTVAERLDDPACAGLEREILELRANVAKTSAAKLDAMLSACTTRGGVGRVRGMLQYYGASRTGRWAGRLIQLQNMPRGELSSSELYAAVVAVQEGATFAEIELLFGNAMSVVSSLLRACIVAPFGRKLVSADFSQIEARVLPWLAGEESVLDVFRSGRDVYIAAAAGIFGVPESEVTKAQRQIGKVAVLALGFGGGKGAFQTMAAAYGVTMTDDRAEEIKQAWRTANPAVVQFWWALDAACRAVLNGRPGVVTVGYIKVGMWGSTLVLGLPGGRGLYYREARLVPNPDRPGQDDITYMGMNQYTRKWERIRTYGGKLAENVTQAVARDCMVEAMLAADDRGYELELTVHDELLSEADDAGAQSELDGVLALMGTPPSWAPDLPVEGDGWVGERYRK